MALKNLDFKGLKCPIPVMKLETMIIRKEIAPGDTVEVIADCPTFAADVKNFCAKNGKVIVSMREMGGATIKVTLRV